MSDSMFTVFEEHLARELGLSRDELRAWRSDHLVGGRDFQKLKKHLRWTEDAKTRFLVAKKLAAPRASAPPANDSTPVPVEPAPPGEKTPPPGAEPPKTAPEFPAVLYFFRAYVNAHVIAATERPNNDRETQPLWMVQVASNQNFHRNQVLPVKPRAGWKLWAILDAPCPRPGQRHIHRHADSPFGQPKPGITPPAPGAVAAEAGSLATA